MILLVVSALLLGGLSAVNAAEYRIGPEDMLKVKFWQDPTLNTDVRVRQDGKISLDIVGEIDAAGKTIQDLQTEIVRQMSRLNRSISQCVVQVFEYNYQHVFVYGQVVNPGKKTFEEIPDMLAILNEAGWLTEFGDLSRVNIIRGGDRAGQIEVVDVAAAIAAGTVNDLPRLNRQDAIDVPRTSSGMASPDLGQAGGQRNVVYVMGAVARAGPVQFDENIDIMEAIARSGGFTEAADIKRTKLIRKDGFYGQAMQIDLEEYAQSGIPARHTMSKEDVIVVPFRKQDWFTRNMGKIVTVITAATSAVLLYENLKPKDEK